MNDQHANNEQRLADIDKRLDRGAARIAELQMSVAELQREMRENTAITTEVRDLLQLARAGLRLLGIVGNVVRWVGMVAGGAIAIWGACYAVWYAVTHGGHLPPK
jgi:hypothetical protein